MMMEQPISVQLRQGADDPNHVMLKLLVHGTEPAIRDKQNQERQLLENDLAASDQDTRHADLNAGRHLPQQPDAAALLTLYEQPNQEAVLQQPSSSKPLGQQAQLPQEPAEPPAGQDASTATTNAATTTSSSLSRSQQTLAGKWCLLVAARPTPLIRALAKSLLLQGARVTLAVRHPRDALLTVRQLSKCLEPPAHALLAASETAIDFASPASISRFAAAVNATTDQGPLDLLLLDAAEGLPGGGHSSRRRWYTPSGVAGNAQEGFVGPASLLHLLQPQLVRSRTRLLLTCSPNHRLGRVDALQQLLHTWAAATPAATQVALLAYVRQLAEEVGLTAAAVDVGVLRETQQLLHLLLPSASDSAQLITSIAGDMMTASEASSSPGGGSRGVTEQEAEAGGEQKQEAGGSEMPLEAQKESKKSFSYYSRGLLAAPLLTSVDLAGSSNRLTQLLSSLAWPWWQLAAGSAITAAQLLDWPVRAWLLAPAGLMTGWSQKLLGSRAVGAIAQLQRLVPGVVGVPQGTAPGWVEVPPSGQVAQGRLGRDAWDYITLLNE